MHVRRAKLQRFRALWRVFGVVRQQRDADAVAYVKLNFVHGPGRGAVVPESGLPDTIADGDANSFADSSSDTGTHAGTHAVADASADAITDASADAITDASADTRANRSAHASANACVVISRNPDGTHA